jgi:hypothetical protein
VNSYEIFVYFRKSSNTKKNLFVPDSARRGRLDGSKEQEAYRGILEMEEILLRYLK